MDKTRGEAYKLPVEWVDRIFLRLSEIYGSRFEDQFTKREYLDLEKYRWRGGLAGLNAAEIKSALNICLNHLSQPPTVIEFYKYAKQHAPAPIRRPEPVKCSPEKQAIYMQKIREKLNNASRQPTVSNQHDSRPGEGDDSIPPNCQSVLNDSDIPAWLQDGHQAG